MRDMLALKGELSVLIRDCSAEFDRIKGMKGPVDRVDAYCALLRGVLSRSTLCTICGKVHWWDGGCYRPVSVADLASTVGNILADDWKTIWHNPRCAAIRAESAKMEHICQLRGKEGDR